MPRRKTDRCKKKAKKNHSTAGIEQHRTEMLLFLLTDARADKAMAGFMPSLRGALLDYKQYSVRRKRFVLLIVTCTPQTKAVWLGYVSPRRRREK